MTDVLVTGRGVISSIHEGADADAFFRGLTERRSGVADGVAPCATFDPEIAMTPKEARRADRFTQFALAAGVVSWKERVPVCL